MSTTVFENVRLVDPASGLDRPGRLLVRDGVIAGVDLPQAEGTPEGAAIVRGDGRMVLCPGLVDMRVTIGEPGFEYRETVASAARAAVAGGITTIAVLPNCLPTIDDPALVRLLRTRGEETGMVGILPYGALTRGCAGAEMAEIGLLNEAGAVAFTDGIRAIGDTRLMRQLLTYSRAFGAMVVQHPEDPSLARGGCATDGELATRLGLPGIAPAAEAILIARDLRLARMTGGRLHFGHVSTAEGLDLIRQAKADGLNVTCDTAPPYFDLNETVIGDFRTYAKLSPPLRAEADRRAVCAALADGTIDAIASDHTPCDADDKRQPFAMAAAGGTGLATLLSVTLAQVHAGSLTLADAIGLLTHRPAALLRSKAGTLAVGAAADLCLFDPERAWKVEAGELPGKAQNTPFDGRALEGRVLATWKAGRQVFSLDRA
ncbi:dihydroorotase [Gluconacetobacter entanii]|uniref:dihydroorotase n=1 Tax=Gluconacetobacter entanii TaxID=108528 RepID=UPI00187B8591|nr:dihydroorotase [Gluconacetobacter entanii]MBE7618159.1 amidohydrolase family protein [Komagataeibacter sp. FXV2]MBY4641098.1 dihydroorotase [Gluconacetobacter entanii]MCW4580618.1 dihydroorotase [Gluconacetobacter entanii]MCW4583992.1 dihydroorotase [Gluconacetobacter entanii]MCW4587292.1 dihydroorotase [Gluconacetobacter entanii]